MVPIYNFYTSILYQKLVEIDNILHGFYSSMISCSIKKVFGDGDFLQPHCIYVLHCII